MNPRIRQPRSRDGRRLQLLEWPGGETGAQLLVIPGKGDHAGRYGELAARLAPLGWSVASLDLRGQGQSEGARSRVGRFEEYLWDLEAGITELRRDHPGKPLVLLGYSMGATVAIQHVLQGGSGIAGLVLVSPCLSIESRLTGINGLLVTLGSHLLPHLVVTRRYHPPAVTTDPEEQQRLAADPLVDGTTRPRLVCELRKATRDCLERAGQLGLPVLTLMSPTDRIVDPDGAERFHQSLAKTGSLCRYPGLRHDLLHERERERVYADLCQWLALLPECLHGKTLERG